MELRCTMPEAGYILKRPIWGLVDIDKMPLNEEMAV